MKLVSKKRVAVTGGAGFIGSHLVDLLLEQGNQVTVVDDFSSGSRENLQQHRSNPNLQIVESDVRNIDILKDSFKGVQTVFHLATNCVRLSLLHPMTNHEVNATGTLNTLIAAKDSGVSRYIYCSSSEVYGNAQMENGQGKLSENSPRCPTTVYGASKLVGENYALAFHQTYGLPAMVICPFNAYGPRSHAAGPYGEVIPRFAALIRGGKEPVIFGDGNQTRDFTYVEDTAAGILASSQCDELLGSSINLAIGEEVSVKDLTLLLCRLLSVPFRARFVADRPGDIRRLGCDTTKVLKLLPGVMKTSFEAGVRKYLAWLEKQNIDFNRLASELTECNWKDAA